MRRGLGGGGVQCAEPVADYVIQCIGGVIVQQEGECFVLQCTGGGIVQEEVESFASTVARSLFHLQKQVARA